MATYYTKADARAYASIPLRRSHTTDSKRLIREAASATKDYERFDVFLSHSSKDAELILGVKTMLEHQGLSVYVDWVDDAHLSRESVTSETAAVLRRRMRQSSSLIWAATEAASGSKWMPWELGYFDGYKPNQVAILPLVDRATDSFQGQEYLALYPVVGKDQYKNGQEEIFVEGRIADGNRRWTTLKSFGEGDTYWRQYGS